MVKNKDRMKFFLAIAKENIEIDGKTFLKGETVHFHIKKQPKKSNLVIILTEEKCVEFNSNRISIIKELGFYPIMTKDNKKLSYIPDASKIANQIYEKFKETKNEE